jgi:hypothetical protein
MCLDVLDPATGNFATVAQTPCHGYVSQSWQYRFLDHGFFMLRNSASGECLGLVDFSHDNGAPVVQLPCNPDDDRVVWIDVMSKVHAGSPGTSVPLMFVSAPINKCLDVENGWPVDRLPMQLWTCNFKTGNQAWLGTV